MEEKLWFIPITDSLLIRVHRWNVAVYAMKEVSSRFRQLRGDFKRHDDNRQRSPNVFCTIVNPYQYKALTLLMECAVLNSESKGRLVVGMVGLLALLPITFANSDVW